MLTETGNNGCIATSLLCMEDEMCSENKPPGEDTLEIAQKLFDATLAWMVNFRKANPDITHEEFLRRMVRDPRIQLEATAGECEFQKLLEALADTASSRLANCAC